MNKKRLINTFLITFGIVGGLFIAEFSVRLILPQNRMVTWLEMHPEGFMMNQSGGNSFQELDERTAYYRFTNTRLRGEQIVGDKTNILAIGDSFTFGLLLNEEDTYVHHIQNKLDTENDSVQLLNGGVGGAGLADWPAWLDNFGEDVSPDIILYFMHVKDLDRAISKNIYVARSDSLIKTQRWKPRQFMFDVGQKDWYRWLQANSDLANLVVKVLWKHVYYQDLTNNFNQSTSSVTIPEQEELYLTSDYSLNLGISLFQKIHDWCVDNECRLIVTTTGFFKNGEEPNHTTRLYNWLNSNPTSPKKPYPFFDNTACVDSTVSGNLESIRIPEDSHPNEEGARIIADCTWEWLKKTSL